MAYEIGIAASERDLLDKIDKFLTLNSELVESGENWTRIHQTTIAETATTVERRSFAWVAPGSAGADQIYVACETNNSITNDIYNLYFGGGTYFSPLVITNNSIWSGFSSFSGRVGICADSREFKYWLVANGRRFIVITATNGIYQSAYCGFVLPNASPLEFPYPLCIAGSIADTLIRYSTVNDSITSVVDPRSKCFYFMYPDQGWRSFYGRNSGALKVTPHGISNYSGTQWDSYKVMHDTPGGTFPIIPITLCALETSGTNLWGILDGVHWVPGISRVSEDEMITADNRRFIVFQNAFRTETVDYFAVEMA